MLSPFLAKTTVADPSPVSNPKLMDPKSFFSLSFKRKFVRDVVPSLKIIERIGNPFSSGTIVSEAFGTNISFSTCTCFPTIFKVLLKLLLVLGANLTLSISVTSSPLHKAFMLIKLSSETT